MNSQYEVLSPWAEADPIPLRGISPRLDQLAGKKIGLLCNDKYAARPIMTIIEQRLKERFPTCGTSWFVRQGVESVSQRSSEYRKTFEKWVKGVNAVITAVGD